MVWARFPLLSPQQAGARAGPCLLLQGLSALFPRAAQPRGHTAVWGPSPIVGFRSSSEPFPLTSQAHTHMLASGGCLPLDVAEHLGMAQEAAEIYVEHVAGCLQHDVVIVSVTDAQDVGGHTAAGTGVDEVLYSLRGGHADSRT